MEKREGGGQIIARQILSSEIFTEKPDWWFKVWVYLILAVNFVDKGKMLRGSAFFTYSQILREAHVHHQTSKSLSNLIHWLKLKGQIKTQKTTRGFIITVVKYEDFQNTDHYRNDTKKDTEKDTEKTQKRHYIYNKGNKENNKECESPSLSGTPLRTQEETMTEQETTKSSPSHKDLSFSGKLNYYIIREDFIKRYLGATNEEYNGIQGADLRNLKELFKGGADVKEVFNKYFAWYKKNIKFMKEKNAKPSLRQIINNFNAIMSQAILTPEEEEKAYRKKLEEMR